MKRSPMPPRRTPLRSKPPKRGAPEGTTPAPSASPPAAPVRSTTARAAARPSSRRGQLASGTWLERVRALPCEFCGGVGANAHHYPTKGAMGGRVDVLSYPACGSGTTGCHGDCHAGRISEERQADAVGRTVARVLRGLLERIPRRPVADRVRRALIAELEDYL